MKLKTKWLLLGMVVLLMLTLAGPVLAVGVPFTDLENISSKEKILSLQERGYVGGIGGGLFAPAKVITGAESIQLLVNMLDLNLDLVRFIKEPLATDFFPKADNKAWYANTLIIAAVNGVELSKDFDPGEEWTREQFTYQLVQAMEVKRQLPQLKIVPVDFADRGEISTGYDGAIQRALIYKIVQLDAAKRFNPQAQLTRAEAAEQIYNALEYLNSQAVPVK